MKRIGFCCLALLAILLASCSSSVTATQASSPSQTSPATESPAAAETPVKEATVSLELTSDAFANGQAIPVKYSCKGKNVSPALAWGEPPAGTQSFALIVDDPDAPMGTWVHWVLYDIPASTRSLQEAFSAGQAMSAGKNSSGHTQYDGPCPPSGTHRYFFKLYALDARLSLAPAATKEQVLKAMEGHVLAQAELMGTFSK